jgi:hypothetical protein
MKAIIEIFFMVDALSSASTNLNSSLFSPSSLVTTHV